MLLLEIANDLTLYRSWLTAFQEVWGDEEMIVILSRLLLPSPSCTCLFLGAATCCNAEAKANTLKTSSEQAHAG